MKKTFHFIRHGATEGTENHWIYGGADIPLTERGMLDIVRMRDSGVYPQTTGKTFYTSGLIRTTQTLELIYGNVTYKTVPRLREMEVGPFECHTHDELKDRQDYISWLNDPEFVPEGCEKYSEFVQRVTAAFTQLLLSEDRDAVIVCHGGVIALIMQKHFGNDFYKWIPALGRGYSIKFEDNMIKGYDVI